MLLLARPAGRAWKIITGVASLFILVAGFGLLARLEMQGIPPWALAKIVIWLVITGLGHVVAKRFPAQGMAAYWITVGLAMVAAWCAVYKPA